MAFPYFIYQILNPSPHTSILKGLVTGHEHLTNLQTVDDKPEIPPLDTTLLFDRYLEAGRTINVYDWYDSFAAGIESEKPKIKRNQDKDEEDKKWGHEVQARFLRSMHELDLMGFLAGSSRKADHVLRTSFDAN